ncbi:hypothetical protein PTW37_03235 [Arthrobacter agilis]|uniref:hypothetical protein n=1 Tax=Arthrobacter agilis TaxID=37921 RepID=UPI002365320D|nr:hypothetical protein [Arthrobacter agilis]WDF33952.1 hypothetical protein PTW37_03235 [Arthrobacter agilis]
MRPIGHEWDERSAERAQLAAAGTERLRAELRQARYELDLLDGSAYRGARLSVAPAPATRRRRSSLLTTHGLVVGAWLVVVYLLVTLLTQSPPTATDSAPSAPATPAPVHLAAPATGAPALHRLRMGTPRAACTQA